MKDTELTLFCNDEFGQVRTLMIDDNPWFVASDVCKALAISNPTVAVQRLEDDERSKLNLGRQGDTNLINEYGLYSLVLASRKPDAKKFKHWITHDVLPSIRKHGLYAVDELLNDPDLAIKAFTALKEEREKNKQLAADNERMKPKEIFHDAVAGSKSSIPIGDLAKILKQNGIDIGANRMFKWMRENGFLIKRKGRDWNIPTQKSMNAGLFEVKECTIPAPPYVGRTTLVTGFGQTYFIKKFLGETGSAATTSGAPVLN